jgi:hypothetical protein
MIVNDNTNDIRPYGPGKFDTILDSYIYSVSLDGGCDSECGDVGETGRWYGLMRHGHTIFRDHDPFLETLNDAERELLTGGAGVIISEDFCGFVSVDYFDTETELDEMWAKIEAEQQELAEEQEQEEEDRATVGICPACDAPVYRDEPDGPVWTCPADLSEGNRHREPADERITEALRQQSGVFSNCGEDYGFPCHERMPLHSACYEKGNY